TYLQRGRSRWLVAAGAAAGVAFVFKQNLAAFVLMGAMWFLAVAERHLPPVSGPRPLSHLLAPAGLLARLARVAVPVIALLLLPLSALVLVRPYLSPLVFALFVLPLVALSAAAAGALAWRGPAPPAPPEGARLLGREEGFYARLVLLLAGFVAVTLTW